MVVFLTTAIDYLVRQSLHIAAVFALAAAACWLFRKKSAHRRYLLWLLVPAKCLLPAAILVPLAVLPPATSIPPETQPPAAPFVASQSSHLAHASTRPDEPPRRTIATPPLGVLHNADLPTAAAVERVVLRDSFVDSQQVAAVSIPARPWKAWLGGAWLVGVGLFLGYALLRAGAVQRTLRRTRRPIDRETADVVAAAARKLGLKTPPSVYLVDGTAQPFVWGGLRGGIYLPQRFLQYGTPQQREAILSHELAHVARWDAAVNLVRILTQAVFFFHPLVWWANRQIRREREQCCDEIVIAGLGTEPRRYGEAIVSVLTAEYQASQAVPLLAAAGRVNNIEQRLRTILRPQQRFHRGPDATAVAATLLAAVLTLPTTLVLTARGGPTDAAPATAAAPKNGATQENASRKRDADGKPNAEAPASAAAGRGPAPGDKAWASSPFTGRITDRQTGRPIDGVLVSMQTQTRFGLSEFSGIPPENSYGKRETRTDPDGRYAFPLQPKQTFAGYSIEIEATHPDYMPYSRDACDLDAILKHEKLGQRPFFEKISLEPAVQVFGTVVTPDGQPAEGVRIKAYSSRNKNDVMLASCVKTTTDATGAFQLPVVKDGHVVIGLLPETYAPSARVFPPRRHNLGRFVLEPGLTVKGRVVDLDGRPIPNVWVNTKARRAPGQHAPEIDSLTVRSALAGERGEFTLPPLPPGRYALNVAERACDESSRILHSVPAAFLSRDITLAFDAPLPPIELRAVPQVTLAGRLVDGAGKPIAAQTVRLFAAQYGQQISFVFENATATNREGKFLFRSPRAAETRLVFAQDERHVFKEPPPNVGLRWFGNHLELGTPIDDKTDITVLRYVAPILLIKAVDESGRPLGDFLPRISYPAGRPSDGGEFTVHGKPAGHVRFVRQDDGRMRSIELQPDEQIQLHVTATGYSGRSELLRLSEGEVKELEVQLHKEPKQPKAAGPFGPQAAPQPGPQPGGADGPPSSP